jgi:alpha-amylase
MKTVRFVMGLHNHQPVGNFHEVFEKACRMSYHPFLDVADEFPNIRMTLHYSGPLFEWAEANDRRLIERVIAGVRAGRFELMGGGFGEPILTMLSTADAIGQIRLFSEHLRRRYDVPVHGIWLTERIWEAQLAGVLAKAGVEYSVVDDFHFRAVGLRDEDLTGYYITEDQGRLLRMFSGSEFLRYSIPFRDPPDTIEYLRRFATEDGRNVVVYADDGEKFGIWPETYAHVFERGWLRNFFKLLNDNREWIRFSTFAETLDTVPPRGRIYLGDASYREMTEWALPLKAQREMENVLDRLKAANLLDAARPFMRGGTWRNFKVKYVEAAQMYARMVEVSRLVADREAAKNFDEARRALYRGQCNCGYWHGLFGGLYMPFLRFAIYEQLLKAENLLSDRREHPGRHIADLDLDGRPEVKLNNPSLNCYLKPDRGGALYELDDRERGWNLTAVMTRRPEATHRRLVEAVQSGKAFVVQPGGRMQSPHDQVRCKEPGLEKLLQYDSYVRESLLDHFYPANAAVAALKRNEVAEWGDFIGAEYDLKAPPSRGSSVTLSRSGRAGPPGRQAPVQISKRITLGKGGTLEARYALAFPEGAPPDTVFGVEFNFGLMAGNAPDRNYFTRERENLNNLSTLISRPDEPALGLVDEWLKVGIWLHTEPNAAFWAYPVESVNDSDGGFEHVYQGSAVIPHWPLNAKPGEEMVFTIRLEVNQGQL